MISSDCRRVSKAPERCLQHLEALRLGKPRNPSLRPLGRIGPDARGEGRESLQILGDLLVGNAEIPRKGRPVVMERCVGDAS